MSFDQRYRFRVQLRITQRRRDQPLLSGAVGGGDAVGAAILVDRGACDDCQNGIAVSLGIADAFEHHRHAAFAANVAAGLGIERPAQSVGCQHPGIAEGFGNVGLENQVYARDNRRVAVTRLQAAASLMDGDQRR